MSGTDTTGVVLIDTKMQGKSMIVRLTHGSEVWNDKCDPNSANARAGLLKRAAIAMPGIDTAAIEREIQAEASKDRKPSPAANADDPGAKGDAELAKMPADVVDEAKALLRSPDLIARIARDLVDIGIVGEHELAMSVYLMGTSRLLPKPISGIVQGSSSSGKSFVVETTATLFPIESKLLATDLTANALYYLPQGSLRHLFVVAGERSRVQDDDRAERTRALREMQASGVLRKLLAQKNAQGLMETIVIENPGPIAFVETTTLAEIFEEDRNRALLLASDDGAGQTRAVVDAIAARYAGLAPIDAERVRVLHHAAQRLLRRCVVQVPFAPALAEHMPTDRPDARRAIHQVLALVQAVALLHQFQRTNEPTHGSVIAATLDDFAVARELVAAPLARSLGAALPEHVTSFARWLRDAVPPPTTFVISNLVGKAGCRWSKTSAYDLVKPLVAIGFLVEAGQQGRSTLFRITGSLPDDVSTWLPSPEELQL